MYVADAKLTKVIYKETKNKKSRKDKVDVVTLEYTMWINNIIDSAKLIRRHGLLPKGNPTTIKKVMPDLAFLDSWITVSITERTKKKTKLSDMLTYFITKKGTLPTAFTSQGIRVLSPVKFYEREKRSILPIFKLLHGYKIAMWNKDEKIKNNRLKHLLEGGIYQGSTENQFYRCDNIFFHSPTDDPPVKKARDFLDCGGISLG